MQTTNTTSSQSSQPAITMPPETIIEPMTSWVPLNLRELWAYRELIFFMIWRDVKVRYKQTLLGVAWAVIRPFASMIVFSLFFGQLAKIPSDGLPYPVFNYAGLLPWTFFASGLTRTSSSVVSSSGLIQKVYFPRLVIPLAGVISGLPDFGLAFLVLLGMMFYFGIFPSWISIVWLPLLLLLAMVTALGVGLWLAALNVRYRDVGYVVNFVTQLWMFATPVVYPASLLSEPWRTLYGINPMVGVVEGFRWSLLQSGSPPGAMVLVSTLVSVLVLISGLFYFRRMENTFADVV
jgi:lipopolysaccharide transport system permease protein